MTDNVSQQLEDLDIAVKQYLSSVGEVQARAIASAVDDLAIWIAYFRTVSVSDNALELLSGAQAAALETVAYVYLGLGRAAITAIRLQIELILGYTYFKDHPVEWEKVKRTGDGFAMFSAIENYHKDMDRTLATRLGRIEHRAPPYLRHIYRILSAHVHGQSPYTLPQNGPLKSTILSTELINSIVEMQVKSTHALSCFLVAVYANQWPQLPEKFVSRIAQALLPRERRQFFSENA